jgi:hypothetical protein
MALFGERFWGGFTRRETCGERLVNRSRLKGSIANGFWVEVCDIHGPRKRGTWGTLICVLEISRDRGHPPAKGCYGDKKRCKEP